MWKWISGLGALLLSGLVAPVAAAEYRLVPKGTNDMTSAILEAVAPKATIAEPKNLTHASETTIRAWTEQLWVTK